ncbi:hypothetical protein [Crossiella sp. CA198]|uniref:hypothetical protein n=1 Tax=Crossiella sp. CA198 TaxID=3455607 RepID=UPI003F8D4492
MDFKYKRVGALVVGLAAAIAVSGQPASAATPPGGAQRAGNLKTCQGGLVPGGQGVSTPNVEQATFARKVAAKTRTVAELAVVRQESPEQLIGSSTLSLVRNGGKSAVQVGFPQDGNSRINSGGVVVELGSGAVIVEKSMVASTSEQELRAGHGQVDVKTNRTVVVVSGEKIARELSKFEHAVSGDMGGQVVLYGGVDDFQSCLAAAGFTIGWIALIAAVVGCGTICAAIISGGVTSAAAPWVCAGCITVATGVPAYVITECINRFWK